MKIAVISMIREPWGGSEELWADMARQALLKESTIIHSSFNFGEIAFKEEQLIQNGLIHLKRRGFIKPGTFAPIRILQKFIYRIANAFQNPFDPVLALQPDQLLYNGTCYSIVEETYLLKAIAKSGISFSILGHYNQEDGSDISDEQALLLKGIYEKARFVFFISQRSLDNARKRTGAPLTNAMIVRNPVNMAPVTIIPYPAVGEFQLAMVGNLRIVHKGQDIVLRILKTEKWKNRNWHLNIYGSGEDEQLLRELVVSNQLEKRVSFHGKVTDIRQLWKNNHLLLMPSHMEGMPLAVVEAMICGRPCVVTDVGGHAEWIEEDREGWIAAQPDQFERAMEKAWKQQANWEQVGKQAHTKAMCLYDPSPGEKLLKILNQ